MERSDERRFFSLDILLKAVAAASLTRRKASKWAFFEVRVVRAGMRNFSSVNFALRSEERAL